jgi:hypothetical protein
MRYIAPSLRLGKPTWVYKFELTWTEDSSIGSLTKQREVSIKIEKSVPRGEAALVLRDILTKTYPFRDYVLIR